jgi:hypothetical protein
VGAGAGVGSGVGAGAAAVGATGDAGGTEVLSPHAPSDNARTTATARQARLFIEFIVDLLISWPEV